MSDGTDRRGLFKCMAWVGTGVVWTIAGGLPAVPADRAGRFVGLVNVVDLKPGVMGRLGDEQLD